MDGLFVFHLHSLGDVHTLKPYPRKNLMAFGKSKKAGERIFTVEFLDKPVVLGRFGLVKTGQQLHLRESEYKMIAKNTKRFKRLSGPTDPMDHQNALEEAAEKLREERAAAADKAAHEATQAAEKARLAEEEKRKASLKANLPPNPNPGEGVSLTEESEEELKDEVAKGEGADLNPPAGTRTRTRTPATGK